jgi:hypothetical protein
MERERLLPTEFYFLQALEKEMIMDFYLDNADRCLEPLETNEDKAVYDILIQEWF